MEITAHFDQKNGAHIKHQYSSGKNGVTILVILSFITRPIYQNV